MFPAARLVTFLGLALAAAASPIVTINEPVIRLPLAKHINPTNLVANDRARVKHLLSRQSHAALAPDAGAVSAPITDVAVLYTASIGVGNPAQTFDVIVDTGSSNTWVGAATKYHATSTSTNTGKNVSVSYGSGAFSGTEYIDTVTLGSGSIVIANQSIGVASQAVGFSPFDGILGIGPARLTNKTVSGMSNIPTVTDNLYSQGIIPANTVAVSFEPTTAENITNGELSFGGVDDTRFTGSITYTPVTTTYPASAYWGINQSIAYGNSSINSSILASTAGFVDTGTTLIYIASDAYSKYAADTGATFDNTTGLLTVTEAQYGALKSLYFTIGGTAFEFTPNAQLWPRTLNSYIGGTSDKYYLAVSNIGSPSGSGLDFVNGYSFLERFYSVFDSTNQRVGFATTPFTTATTN